MSTRFPRRILTSTQTIAVAVLLCLAVGAGAPVRAQAKREFSVSAHKYAYKVQGSDKSEIRVQEGDLVRITFTSDDIPHSFTIDDDHYRIMKKTEHGTPVVFEFLADKTGTFTFRCTLRADDRCKELSGTLVVSARE